MLEDGTKVAKKDYYDKSPRGSFIPNMATATIGTQEEHKSKMSTIQRNSLDDNSNHYGAVASHVFEKTRQSEAF